MTLALIYSWQRISRITIRRRLGGEWKGGSARDGLIHASQHITISQFCINSIALSADAQYRLSLLIDASADSKIELMRNRGMADIC